MFPLIILLQIQHNTPDFPWSWPIDLTLLHFKANLFSLFLGVNSMSIMYWVFNFVHELWCVCFASLYPFVLPYCDDYMMDPHQGPNYRIAVCILWGKGAKKTSMFPRNPLLLSVLTPDVLQRYFFSDLMYLNIFISL